MKELPSLSNKPGRENPATLIFERGIFKSIRLFSIFIFKSRIIVSLSWWASSGMTIEEVSAKMDVSVADLTRLLNS